VIDKEFGVKSLVIYPPVDTESIKPKRKENIILYVGRFSKMLQSKSQDVLISSFRKMYEEGLKEWKLILAGGVEIGVGNYINELESLSKDLPVEIIQSPDFSTLKNLYGRSKLFWSASGYGQNEIENPEKMEHFGMTVIEAMAGGVVPVIFDGGGHKEIIEDSLNGHLWKHMDELVNKTKNLIDNSKQFHALEINAKKKSKDYDIKIFEEKISTILK
jgi:glycosyltransferase involved in cell wall biosynthesis